jgi:hypothetical protein
MMKNVSKKLLTWITNFILGLIILISLQYLKIEIYFREKNIPFSGEYFYNPYKDYNSNTFKANFHLHSKTGILNHKAENSAKVLSHYKNNGYDIVSLSNYQNITIDKDNDEYIPVYEHGYNLIKSHQLAINSNRVAFFDFSIFCNYHTKQQVINGLKQKGGLIALAHPELRNGYTEDEMKYLRGYDFIEVCNNYAVSDKIWDSALSNGYPAWILADDDCHDILRPSQSFNNWTRISSKGRSKNEILEALKKGCHYGVRNLSHKELNSLDSCCMKGDELTVYFRSNADRIMFITDKGLTRKEVKNVRSATYRIARDDHYIRIEAATGKEIIYLNPVIRFNGYQLTNNMGFPLVNSSATILFRFLMLLLTGSLVLLLLNLNGVKVIPAWRHKYVQTISENVDLNLI